MHRIYLDNNATTRIDPGVAECMLRAQQELLGNPASQHWAGQHARRMLEDARDSVAGALGARTSGSEADRLIFTSGGTESNNLALLGIAGVSPGVVITSAVEHPSVRETYSTLRRLGHRVVELPVDSSGVVAPGKLADLLTPDTRLVSVMLANNETGVLQPIDELAAICRDAAVPLHTDAVQATGKVKFRFEDLGVTAMTVSAHKFHGPVGVGALVARQTVTLQPIHFGGFQQLGARPGTEAVALAVGMARALREWEQHAESRATTLRLRRDQLEESLISSEPGLRIHGREARRAPQTSCISFPGVDRQEMAMALDLAGVACATGSACASGSSEPSHVLQAMGLAEAAIQSALRFSVSHLTSEVEIEQAASRIVLIYRNLRHGGESEKSALTPRNNLTKSI